MVYGIEVAKVGRGIRIIILWTLQTVLLNGRSRVSLECTNLPDGGVYKRFVWSREDSEISWIMVRLYGRAIMNGDKEWNNWKGCGEFLVGLYC